MIFAAVERQKANCLRASWHHGDPIDKPLCLRLAVVGELLPMIASMQRFACTWLMIRSLSVQREQVLYIRPFSAYYYFICFYQIKLVSILIMIEIYSTLSILGNSRTVTLERPKSTALSNVTEGLQLIIVHTRMTVIIISLWPKKQYSNLFSFLMPSYWTYPGNSAPKGWPWPHCRTTGLALKCHKFKAELWRWNTEKSVKFTHSSHKSLI